jgi:hypothetical protein
MQLFLSVLYQYITNLTVISESTSSGPFNGVDNRIWKFPLNSYICGKLKGTLMFWTLELASYLEDAPWPATKDELIDYAIRSGAPIEVVENLQELEDDGEIYEGVEDIWPDYPTQEDFFFNEDEY